MVQPLRRAPTRADVARLSGVSTAVVSYVLNDGPKAVAPATKEKVLEAVRALGYRPNAAARALSKGSADLIGMLVGDTRNPFSAQLSYSVDKAAGDHGRTLLVVNSENGVATQSEHIRELAARQISGLISMRKLSGEELDLLSSFRMPTVLVNQLNSTPGTTSVGVDYREGARRAVEHLLGHGYQGIAFAGIDDAGDGRERGWMDAVTAAAQPLGERVGTTYSLRGGYEAGMRLGAGGVMPRAVFAASDQIGIGLLAALHERGFDIPGDIAVVSFDGIREAEYSWPPLTTAAQPLGQIAERAVNALLDWDDLPRSVVVPTELVIRRSCGCTRRGATAD